MANDNTKLQYIVELLTQGDTKRATEELNKLQQAGGLTNSAMAGLQRTVLGLYAAFGGTQFIMQSIDAFLEAERSVAKLNAALQSTNQFTPETSKQFQALAEQLAQVSAYADEAILNVIAKLIAMGARTQDVDRLTKAILNLSTLMDRDLNRATLAFTQALNGNVGALKAAGVQIDETRFFTEQLNDALQQIERRAGGQTAASVETLGGRFEQMKKNVGEVKEALGGLTLEAIDPFTTAANKAAKSLTGFLQSFKEYADLLKQLSASGESIISGFFGVTGNSAVSQANFLRMMTGLKTSGELAKSPSNPSRAAMMARGSSTAAGGEQGQITTDALLDEDLKRRLAELDEVYAYEDSLIEKINEQYERNADLRIKRDNEAFENYRNAERLKQDLIGQTLLTQLEGEARVIAEMRQNHEERVRMIQDTKFETEEQYMEVMNAEAARYEAEKKRYAQAQTYSYKLGQDMKRIAADGEQAFASGLAGAIVSAFEEGDKAFQKFAANFLRQISEMILQALILRAVQGITGSIFGGGGGGGGGVSGGVSGSGAAYAGYAANGGQFVNKFANGGIAELSSPTYFPKFNVLAGEAGREVMTVLSRPRFERINGVPMQIGYAQGNRLAIANTDAMAGAAGGMGGTARIVVELAPGMVASIKEESIQGARVQIVQDMASDSQLSRVTRQKMA